jgi:hypothetical protein
MLFQCWKCGKKLEYPSGGRVLRADACPQCNANLHCCRNCEFYDPSKYNQCAETQAGRVRDKEAVNHCDYFQPNPILMACRGGPSDADDMKKKAVSLFKA